MGSIFGDWGCFLAGLEVWLVLTSKEDSILVYIFRGKIMHDKFYSLVCNQLTWRNVIDVRKAGVLRPIQLELALVRESRWIQICSY